MSFTEQSEVVGLGDTTSWTGSKHEKEKSSSTRPDPHGQQPHIPARASWEMLARRLLQFFDAQTPLCRIRIGGAGSLVLVGETQPEVSTGQPINNQGREHSAASEIPYPDGLPGPESGGNIRVHASKPWTVCKRQRWT